MHHATHNWKLFTQRTFGKKLQILKGLTITTLQTGHFIIVPRVNYTFGETQTMSTIKTAKCPKCKGTARKVGEQFLVSPSVFAQHFKCTKCAWEGDVYQRV